MATSGPFLRKAPQRRLEGRKGTEEHQPLGLAVSLVCALVLGSGASRQGEGNSPLPTPAQKQDKAPGFQVPVSQAHATCQAFTHFYFIATTECGRCPDFN